MERCNCPGNPFSLPSRREFLTVGAMGAMGFALGDLLRWEQAGAAERTTELAGDAKAAGVRKAFSKAGGPKAKSIIHIFLPGGMAHQESFDPKPFAPLEYRGAFGTIKTKIPGEVFCETLPNIAGIADKICVVRSMSHGEAAHELGTQNMFTGYKPSPALQYPSIGSIMSHELGPRENLPPYVCIPNQPNPYAGTGYLSSAFGPFSLGADPAKPGFQVRDLALTGGVDDSRFTRRRRVLEAVNAHFESIEKADSIGAMDTFYQQAYGLISSAKARAAFNLNDEPDAIRDDYGRNEAGGRLLMARRLIAAGVRMVTVAYGGWDFHQEIQPGMKKMVPSLDKAYAALIRDLDRTGLLDSTIVMLSSEFGRSPKINVRGGRDHWPRVFSIALAGGGIARGKIFGSSNATGAEPGSDDLGPADLFATLYHQLGIDFTKKLMSAGGRPIDIVREGKVREGILG